MDNQDRIIEKIERLIALSSSNNEYEAQAAMAKAQELMAKYEIRREQLGENEKERQVICFTSVPFRDEWTHMVSGVIAQNFRCRRIAMEKRGSGGTFRIRFYGYEEDAEICINIFNYAVKVVRKRFATLRAIYAEANRDFGFQEKMNYVLGFCNGLERNFEEQKKQSQSFALALATPKAVIDFVDSLPGLQTSGVKTFEINQEQRLLRETGYIDGKAFQNVGDKERLEN